MASYLRFLMLVTAALAASSGIAADRPRAQNVSLRVTIDAQGKVQTAQPSDPKDPYGLNAAAEALSRTLTFSPAKKNGAAVPSETTLNLLLSLEPRADGKYGLHLKRASNGPAVVEVGRTTAPKYQQGRENGALIVVAVVLLADGTPDMSTFAMESAELRVPSAFGEKRYVDAVETSLRNSRFKLDLVDGVSIPTRITVPYQFGGGPRKIKQGEKVPRKGAPLPADQPETPVITEVSAVPGVELASINYTAPEQD
jgi:hypothetical protein